MSEETLGNVVGRGSCNMGTEGRRRNLDPVDTLVRTGGHDLRFVLYRGTVPATIMLEAGGTADLTSWAGREPAGGREDDRAWRKSHEALAAAGERRRLVPATGSR
jgi:hypothetical protein